VAGQRAPAGATAGGGGAGRQRGPGGVRPRYADHEVDQKLPSPPRAGPGHDEHDHGGPPPKAATQLLKIVFLGVATGLAVSTLIGLWMALQNRLRRRTNLILLAIGLLLPLLLIIGLT